MARIYSPPAYQMGEAEIEADDRPITRSELSRARSELARMKRSLTKWLKYRAINDAVAAGQPLKAPLLRTPGARTPTAVAHTLVMTRARLADEQPLALELHTLLSEIFDPAQLPAPDLAKNPNAAVELAQIAIAGKLPGESTAQQPVGMSWLWPLGIVVGAVAFVITTAIRSKADVAKERERLECVKAGACTDTGFWLKIGAIAVVGWIVWDRMGLRERVTGALKGKRRGR
jgi:hypothetical protein